MADLSDVSKKPLRLAIDVHGFSGRHQGSRTFIENVYREIPSVDPSIEVISFGEVEPPDFPVSRHVPVDLGSAAKRLTVGSYAALRSLAPDYVHYQYFCPLLPVGRSVITIHDILPITHPQYFNPSFAGRFRMMVGLSMRLASLVNAVSDFTRDAVAAQYSRDPETIAVVPNGVSADFYRSVSYEEARAYVKEKFGLDSYVLSLTRIERRKNIPLLIDAVSRLQGAGLSGLQTVLMGSIDESSGGGCARTRQAIADGTVIHLKGLSDQEKIFVLRAAAVLVFPSMAEGFGIPPLEGMAARIPVIVADQTAHGRIYRDTAIMISGESVEELADRIRAVLSDDDLRRQAVARGDGLVERMTWKRSAAALADSLRRDAAERAAR
ncbi:putative glycosyltransferase EpsD [Hartmannibacter diazotrophicus]|uniref:Putative glycosyltransferase EpsD n=1 Tax=Hartmannibacter diazotrophicus TaxID=1482074 RepID=A0A2C9DDN7_9HYPH|nr:glycosyltransferase family 1 protein [Hartmannibacter diazotrophicus]SON58363.1 putative glycosyltransferase EpsD [Hartmannibacter diazotrophicus]